MRAKGGPVYPIGGTPAQPAPALPQAYPVPVAQPPVQRFIKWGDSMVCTVCQLDIRYCRGHAPPPPPPGSDGAEPNLERRIREVKGGR